MQKKSSASADYELRNPALIKKIQTKIATTMVACVVYVCDVCENLVGCGA